MCLEKNKHLLSRPEGSMEPRGGKRGPGRDAAVQASPTDTDTHGSRLDSFQEVRQWE